MRNLWWVESQMEHDGAKRSWNLCQWTLRGIKRDLKNIIRYLASNDGNYEAVQMKKLDIQLFMIKSKVLKLRKNLLGSSV